jgi:phosphatidylglycerophosphate synthase
MFIEFFNKETNKKQRANMWTFLRLIIPLITIITSIIAISVSSPVLFLTTGLIAGFGAVTDYFDGKSSRKHNSVSQYGKLLDQISDKIFAGIIGINLLFINFNYIFVLLGELLIAGVNVGYKLKYNDLDITSTKMGKIKEWPLFVTLALGFLSPINPTLLSISNISILLTILFQLKTAESYLINNSKEAKKLENKKYSINVQDIEEKEISKENILTKEKQNIRLQQYKNLRDVLNQIIDLKHNNEEINIENYQKTKEL